jgi:hypothetical protein
VPFKQLLENSLSSRFNDIAMARHDGIKVKRADPRGTGIKRRPIAHTQAIPQEALLAEGVALGVGHGREPTRRHARGRRIVRLGELLVGGQVGEVVGHQERATRLVAEDQLLVGVRWDVFVVELSVELRVDLGLSQLRFLEDHGERHVFVLLLGPLFGQSLDADYFGVWILLVPVAKEYVVLERVNWRIKGAFCGYLKVRRRDVLQFAQRGERFLDVRG